MEEAMIELLNLVEESGYVFFASESKWKYISY